MEGKTKTFGHVSNGSRSHADRQGLDFRRVADTVPGCILVADADGKVLYANKRFVAALGRPLEELLGEGWLESVETAFLKEARAKWYDCIRTRVRLDVTWRFRVHDGTSRWQHLRAEPSSHEESGDASWYLLGVDVDEQFRAQEALQASEREAREILDRVPAMISTWTEEGVAYTNKRLSDYVGTVITDLRDGSYLDYLHPYDRDAVVAEHIESPNKVPNDIIYRLLGTDGIYRWFHTRAEPYFNEDGSIYRWYALNSDIDDLCRSRELLRERELQLNLLTETLPAILWKADLNGQITYINKKAVEYSGRTLEVLQEKGWIDLVHPDDVAEIVTVWNELLAGGEGYDNVNRFKCADGLYYWFHTSASVIRDEAGNRIAFHGVMLDTTPLKAAETALQQSEQEMQRLMDTVPTIIWSMSPDGNAAFTNKVARELTGASLEEIQNGKWIEYTHPEDRELVSRELSRALATGNSFGAAHRLRKRDGTWRWFLSRAEPSRDNHGNIVRWFGVMLDIHDGKVAEGKLRELRANLSQTSRASLVSEISASIAHELNQPLSSLLSNAQACFRWLKAATPNIENAITSIERVVRDGRAADAAIRNIRSLYKQQPTAKASFNMVELLGEVIGLLKEDASRRSTPIEYEFEDPALEVLVDRYQIQQIIINLVTNAIDAMQDIDRQPLLRIRIRNAEGGRVLTEFIDNGHGLPDDRADRIFDAFVSTKENGMGIGLAISRSIVEAHDGELWAADNPGDGATFSLLLKGSGASQG
ncbi:PAS domain-containing protein [Edaphobacter modestus]|uniref:PAS domain-containing protein n=1 Tax=Edaphobacter modestus TaxID=388466 RepID=UPI0013EED0EA|nr:PAS domain-containing sensor histidine kinase [Edaphobacter modestus]